MKWELRNDWAEWEYRFLNRTGSIVLRNRNNKEHWELRDGNDIVTMRTVWMGDFTEWSISDGKIKLVVKTRFNNLGDEWIIEDKKYGEYLMFTEWEGDPRDWIIEDFLSEEISVPMRLAIMHIVLMQSAPKI